MGSSGAQAGLGLSLGVVWVLESGEKTFLSNLSLAHLSLSG